MYITKICNENTGSIERVLIRPELTETGMPKPVLIVGENGTGKSTVISNIVDSFYELANVLYTNAMYADANYRGRQYFKTLTPTEIKIGKKYMFSSIEYKEKNDVIFYNFIGGKLDQATYKSQALIPESTHIRWEEDVFQKNISCLKQQAKQIFSDNIFCYFGPDRYARPQWMGKSYFEDREETISHLSYAQHISGEIINPIQENEQTQRTLEWLLDVIADSRPDVEFDDKQIKLVHLEETNDLRLLGIARRNIETIMSRILGRDVYFGLNYRSAGGSRFSIIDAENGEKIIPTLDSLSTGQSALFNIFATLIRYADHIDINKSICLEDIQGIVVIDEIDLHLHTVLQKEVLPKLFKLFPKIQFIISTHSPLFILGMNETYGEEGLSIIQMPTGVHIAPETFSEFQKAYQYMLETETHQKEIERILTSETEKVLVLTEGATDWRHIKAAWNSLKNEESYKNLSFELLEYDSKSGTELPKIDMSSPDLLNTCKYLSNLPRKNKIILITDADVPNDMKKMKEEGKNYKAWGNNVFSIVLPVPEHRKDTPQICIEHYYTDHDLMKPIKIGDVMRRIYMGREFDSSGLSISDSPRLLCLDRNSCGAGKINIIDGQEKKEVKNTSVPEEQRVNLALSKMAFAKAVLDPPTDDFKTMDFSAFRLLFDVMKEIIEL